MSRTRKRQSRKRSLAWRSWYPGWRRSGGSEGTHGLREDLVAHLQAQGGGRREVDARAHHVGEEVEQAHEGEQAHARLRIELDEHVDVAVHGGLVAGRRAEDRDMTHVEGAQFLAVAVET